MFKMSVWLSFAVATAFLTICFQDNESVAWILATTAIGVLLGTIVSLLEIATVDAMIKEHNRRTEDAVDSLGNENEPAYADQVDWVGHERIVRLSLLAAVGQRAWAVASVGGIVLFAACYRLIHTPAGRFVAPSIGLVLLALLLFRTAYLVSAKARDLDQSAELIDKAGEVVEDMIKRLLGNCGWRRRNVTGETNDR